MAYYRFDGTMPFLPSKCEAQALLLEMHRKQEEKKHLQLKQAEEHKQRIESLRNDFRNYLEKFNPQASNPVPLRPPDPLDLIHSGLISAIKAAPEAESEKESDASFSISSDGFRQDVTPFENDVVNLELETTEEPIGDVTHLLETSNGFATTQVLYHSVDSLIETDSWFQEIKSSGAKEVISTDMIPTEESNLSQSDMIYGITAAAETEANQRVTGTAAPETIVTQPEESIHDIQTALDVDSVEEHGSVGFTDLTLEDACVCPHELFSKVPLYSLEPSHICHNDSLDIVDSPSDLECVTGKADGCVCDVDQTNSIAAGEFLNVNKSNKLCIARESLLLNSSVYLNPRLLHDKGISDFVGVRFVEDLIVVFEQNKAVSSLLKEHYNQADMKFHKKHKWKFKQSLVVSEFKTNRLSAFVAKSNKTEPLPIEVMHWLVQRIEADYSPYKKFFHVLPSGLCQARREPEVIIALAKPKQSAFSLDLLDHSIVIGLFLEPKLEVGVTAKLRYDRGFYQICGWVNEERGTPVFTCNSPSYMIVFSVAKHLLSLLRVSGYLNEFKDWWSGTTSAFNSIATRFDKLGITGFLNLSPTVPSLMRFNENQIGTALHTDVVCQTALYTACHFVDHERSAYDSEFGLRLMKLKKIRSNADNRLNAAGDQAHGVMIPDRDKLLSDIVDEVFLVPSHQVYRDMLRDSMFFHGLHQNQEKWTEVKRLLVLADISLLVNGNDIDFTFTDNWFHIPFAELCAYGVFHLLRPPELRRAKRPLVSVMRTANTFKGATVFTLTLEQFEYLLTSIPAYEMFHYPRPPDLSFSIVCSWFGIRLDC